MVSVTNRLGLPTPLVNALNRQHYSRGASRASVTQLIDAPRIDVLRKKNAQRIEVDAADGLWALLGSTLHAVLENGADEDHLPEERLFAEVDGWTISGGIDLQRLQPGPPPTVGIRDYKLTSVWSVLNPKPAWTNQLNCYAWLVRQAKGWQVADIEVVAILRDWQRSVARHTRDYPLAPVQRVPVPLWSPEVADAYVRRRVRLHQDADRADQWGEDVPPCSPEERWAKPTTYAVLRPGRKTALKVFRDEAEAHAFCVGKPDAVVATRPGGSTRCAGNYCGVAAWCGQWRAEQGDSA